MSRFTPNYMLTNDQTEAINQTRISFEEIEARVEMYVPAGREKALTLTKLEEACHWAIKAISIGEPKS